MCPININTDAADDSGGEYERKPGRYRFKCDTAELVKFKTSGNAGIKLTLLLDDGGKRDAKCFDNLVAVDNMMWRWKRCCECLGVPFVNPLDERSLEGKIGIADFEVNERGYYAVKMYLPPDAEGAKPARKREQEREPSREPGSDDEPPPPTDDDVFA